MQIAAALLRRTTPAGLPVVAIAALLSMTGCQGVVTVPPIENPKACSPDVPNGECPTGQVCVEGACATPPPTCSDDTQNGDESDIDCGGSCGGCPDGRRCEDASDCASRVCNATCQTPTCGDDAQNGDETDVDCGGSCGACADGRRCGDASDCTSGVCNVTCQTPTCDDDVTNGDETAPDCGGSCPPCADGASCAAADDCESHVCDVTCRPATCADGAINGNETSTDCGGSCPRCAIGEPCLIDEDCVDNACTNAFCTAADCFDGSHNGDETGTDCGGPRCPACSAANAPCQYGSDCQSGVCNAQTSTCAAPTCSDHVKNGDETGVDCGGSCAALGTPQRCDDGAGCTAVGDCASGVCDTAVTHRCVPATCNDGSVNGSESDLNCGGAECAPCAANKACRANEDCLSLVCANHVCQAPSCTDHVQNGGEVAIDCGGGCTCLLGQPCGSGADCASGSCVAGRCVGAGCQNNTQDGLETGVDCGGDCAPCATGVGCTDGTDCRSGVCSTTVPHTCQDPSCSDTLANGLETGPDCGFVACATTCDPGEGCESDWDCTTHVCDLSTHVCAGPTCSDHIKNGLETGLDCGGPCQPCAVDVGCSVASECVSGVCGTPAGCTNPPCTCQSATCSDGVANGTETGRDCGGPCVAQNQFCPVGGGCIDGTDCESGECVNFICVLSHCVDFTYEPELGETDVDCGGADCAPCGLGLDCFTGADCVAGSCGVRNSCTPQTGPCTCQAPSCFDGVYNGTELATDCGDTCDAGCPAGTLCDDATDCESGLCSGRCQAPTCSDHIKNGDETDVDCAGPCAARCGSFAGCESASDCASGVCGSIAGCTAPPCICQPPSCEPPDGVMNGLELGMDCGGPGCPGCDAGTVCDVASDCKSGVCSGTPRTCQAPSCDDGVLNGTETAQGCGGGDCPACGEGQACLVNSDCQTSPVALVCGGSKVCVRADSCTTATDKTGPDCGGAICPACGVGVDCLAARDCTTGVCGAPLPIGCATAPDTPCQCVAADCNDNVKNGDEAAVDCGGTCTTKCDDLTPCDNPNDCESGVCAGSPSVCQPPSCVPADSVHNGIESGVDCGGTNLLCPRCPNGGGCGSDADCASALCDTVTLHTCQPPSCTDSRTNGGETDQDCGGPCAASGHRCDPTETCAIGNDCTTFVCTNGTQPGGTTCPKGGLCCQDPSCLPADGQKNGTETDVDCGGTGCPKCAVTKSCNASSDCTSGSCGYRNVCASPPCTCQAPSCNPTDGVQNGTETDIDCGGSDSACARCANGKKCVAVDGSDCQSQVCSGGFCANPTCTDGKKNGVETDVDCGGSVCGASYSTKCDFHEACGSTSTGVQDCKEKVCGTAGCPTGVPFCCQGPTCGDGQQNGDETGPDCGGSCVVSDKKTCADNLECRVAADCQSGVCGVGNVCDTPPCTCQPASCPDGVQNQNETDLDCGGPSCTTKCQNGDICEYGARDCLSQVCLNGGGDTCDPFVDATCTCATSGCTDGIKNGLESGIDCGGDSLCPDCAPGRECTQVSDCASGICGTGATTCDPGATLCCQAPRCGDGIVNGAEQCESGVAITKHCNDADVLGASSTGTLACNAATCTFDTSNCCGDGVKGTDEDCDRLQLGGTACSDLNDATHDFVPGVGVLACNSTCDGFVTTGCIGCGNRRIDNIAGTDEPCDGTALGGATCASLGYDGGNLACAADCSGFVTTGCFDTCGNGTLDNGELCDPEDHVSPPVACPAPFTSGNLTCNSTCSGWLNTACSGGCGNNTREGSEVCDGTDNNGQQCTTLRVCYGGTNNGLPCTTAAPTTCPVCDFYAGGTLDCNANCLDFNRSGCFRCGDLVVNKSCSVSGAACTTDAQCGAGGGTCTGGEKCDGTNLDGKTCASLGYGNRGTPTCAAGCAGFAAGTCSSCGNNIREQDEVCDGQAPLGKTCADFKVCSGGSNNGKPCTVAADCPSPGLCVSYNGGELACNGSCAGYDTSHCSYCDTAACNAAGGSCVDGVCDCGDFLAWCGNACVSLRTDASNCGACGNACTKVCVGGSNAGATCALATECASGNCATAACSAGVCSATCQSPLTLCSDHQCVDTRTDNKHCGTCTNDCTLTGKVCNFGSCVSPLPSLTNPNGPDGCPNGGPAIDLNEGVTPPVVPPSVSCGGDMAAVSFRWALCTCNSTHLNQDLFADGFDSRDGPYVPTCEDGMTPCTLLGYNSSECFGVARVCVSGPNKGLPCSSDATCAGGTGSCGVGGDYNGDGFASCADEIGAGIGINGNYWNGSTTTCWGTMWWGGDTSQNVGTVVAAQDWHANSVLGQGAVYAAGNGYTSQSITSSGRVLGDLYQDKDMSLAGTFTYGGSYYHAADVSVGEPCDCSPTTLLPVGTIVRAHACTHAGTGYAKCVGDANDNAYVQLNPDIFKGGSGGRLELPCGMYYLSEITANGKVSIVVKGRAALFVGGHINMGSEMALQIESNGELDIFVGGSVKDNKDIVVGTPSFPARTRIYVAAGQYCTSGPKMGYPCLADADCPPGTSGICSARTCEGGANAGAVCLSDSQCASPGFCPTRICSGGTNNGKGCRTDSDCPPTGTGQCAIPVPSPTVSNNDTFAMDLSNYKAAANTYSPWGTTSMPQSTAVYGSLLTSMFDISNQSIFHFDTGVVGAADTCPSDCGNGIINDGEQCDGALLGGRTCQTQGFAGGTLLCTNSCLIDTSACYKCGDGRINAGEQCDPGNPTANPVIPPNMNGQSCATQIGTGALGALTCNQDCTLNTGACHRCGNNIIEPGELCDGTRLPTGVGCGTLGFDEGVLACNASCTGYITDGCYSCGDGVIDPLEECDPGDPSATPLPILPAPENPTCQEYGYTGGSMTCRGDCTLDRSTCTLCGDQVRQGGELCDGADLGGQTCSSRGFPNGGTLTCTAGCSFDTSGCCGNGVVRPPEQCDGSVPAGVSCQSLGFSGGTLTCGANCRFDISGCTTVGTCGDGTISGSEQCEPTLPVGSTCESFGFTGGVLTCTSCRFDFSSCTFCGNGILQRTCVGGDNPGAPCANDTECTGTNPTPNGTCSGGEECDGTQFGSSSCETERGAGYVGNLACLNTCQIDASACFLCGDGTAQGTESCDDNNTPADPTDDDRRGQTCATLGLGQGTLGCNDTCDAFNTSGCFRCGNGVVNKTCVGDHVGQLCTDNTQCGTGTCTGGETCDPPGTTTTCSSLGAGTGTATCLGNCTWDTSTCVICGNNRIDGAEVCDTNALGGQTCVTRGFDGGTLQCLSGCNGFDTSLCYRCGDGDVDIVNNEECDPGASPPATWNLNGQRCQDFGFSGGTLGCRADCKLDKTGCYGCGDGVLNVGETCDPGDGGTIPPALNGNTCATLKVCSGNTSKSCTSDANCTGLGSCGVNFVGGTLGCLANCSEFNVTQCYKCGDGSVNPGEQCEGSTTTSCQSLGIDDAAHDATCVAATCKWDTSACIVTAVCGSGGITPPEQCDPSASPSVGTATCESLGYRPGTGLACNDSTCRFDTSNCCGDGVKGTSETCDGADLGGKTCATLGQGFIGGTLGCNASCGFDTSGCYQCTSCRDCSNQACVNGKCGACTNSSQCCAPLLCVSGRCTLF